MFRDASRPFYFSSLLLFLFFFETCISLSLVTRHFCWWYRYRTTMYRAVCRSRRPTCARPCGHILSPYHSRPGQQPKKQQWPLVLLSFFLWIPSSLFFLFSLSLLLSFFFQINKSVSSPPLLAGWPPTESIEHSRSPDAFEISRRWGLDQHLFLPDTSALVFHQKAPLA